jgi:hypothetical protein
VELAVVATLSFFCAHAPKLKAPAKTAMIMITFRNFNSISPPFPASCCRLLGKETGGRNAFLEFFHAVIAASWRARSQHRQSFGAIGTN